MSAVVEVETPGVEPRYVAVCAECQWESIKSLFKFYPQADAVDHNAAVHGGRPRHKSTLIDGKVARG